MKRKLSDFHKKIIFDTLLLILVLFAISVISLILLSVFKIVTFEGGRVRFDPELFDSFKYSWYGAIIFILFQTIATILLCVIPGTSMAFIILSTNIYDRPWEAFLLSFISVIISSAGMYLVGRYGGYKLCSKLLGKEDCDRSLAVLRTRGTIYFPLMMLFPFFPDDALVMMAGTVKMRLSWFLPSIIVCRGIGVATIVFGLTIIPFESFTTLYDWIVFLTVCLFWIILMFRLAHKLNNKLEKPKEIE